MSILGKDQELEKRAPLQDVAAPLRDQIPAKLRAKLVDMEIGRKVDELWRLGNAGRSEWLMRQQVYLQSWDEFRSQDSSGPFKGSSNLKIPMPFIVAKTFHARFLSALLGIDPPFTTKARTEASIPRAELVQDVMAYTLKDWCNFYQGAEAALDTWVWEWCTTGSGILKARWECEYESFVDVQLTPEAGPVQFSVDENGREVQTPTTRFVEKEKRVTKKIFEGPVLEPVLNEDFLIIGGDGEPQLADSVHHRQFMTASQLWTLADRKIFDTESVQKIIDGGADRVDGQADSGIKIQRKLNAGGSMVDTEADLDRYEVTESYLKLDVDGSGINSNVVTWVHRRSGELLRATYLRRINKAGERPFFKVDFHRRTGQDYGIGLVEMLYPLSVELNAIHNMRIDNGILANMPIGFYRSTSSINPETIYLEPGALIPLDNPQTDIYFPQMGNRTAFGMQEEQAIQTLVERLTGVNDMSLGVLSGAQGATRTATGARALVGEQNSNLDVHLRRLTRGWKQVLKFMLHMLQQRIPKGLSFRVTGEAGSDYWAQVKGADDIMGEFDFEISPNSANSNPQIQQEKANLALQTTQNPLDIQLGIVTPNQRYEALKFYYKANGFKDYSKFIQKPPNYQYVPNPESEVDMLLRGIDCPVLPQGDHQGFLDYFDEIYKSDELLGQFNEEQVKRLAGQVKQHKQMMQAVQQMQAQQANADQMRNNAAQSQHQAPPAMNPMQSGQGAPAPAPQN